MSDSSLSYSTSFHITSHSFLSNTNTNTMHFLLLLLLFFFFFFFCCCCYGENNVWHLNHSFSFNSSNTDSFYNASYFYQNSEDQNFVLSPLDLNISYSNPEGNDAYAFLCFTSPTPPRLLSYTLSICLTTTIFLNDPYLDPAIVWSANRGNPVRGEKMTLTLDETGNLVLRGDPNDKLYWASNTSHQGVVRMELSPQYPVNLILFDSNNNTIWQSVDYPTDILTFNQSLKQGMKLVSWASSTDPSEGNYSLVLEHSGVVLFSNIPTPRPYRIGGSCSNTLESVKNSSCSNVTKLTFDGPNGLESNTTSIEFAQALYVNSNTSLLRLEWDGNVRAYAIRNHGSTWSKAYDMFTGSSSCSFPMRCGPYGVCRGQGQCTCPGGNSPFFVVLNESTQSCGLAQPLQIYCPLPGNNSTATQSSGNLQMLELQGLDYVSNVYTSPLHNLRTKERCTDECLLNCSCLAAFWHNHSHACFHVDQMGALLGDRVDEYGEIEGPLNSSYYAFLKVEGGQSNHEGGRSKLNRNYVIAGVVSGLASLLLLFFFFYFIYPRVGIHLQWEGEEEEEAIMDAIPGLPARYSYKEIYSATNGFANKLGHGGFGSVYAGTLVSDGITTKVAVKQLEGVRQGDKEFRSEVAIMGAIHHFNLLRLLGFCAQGSHRLLVYEYMENGSLDQCLFIRHRDTMKTPLPWDVRCKIGLGAARGLAYLHDECRERILHLDIKPQNILLDENFVAKVADFGLSRLMERDTSHVMTTMRGTPGYLAPEWLNEGAIDAKCDVYSFGMLLFEIISGRKNLDQTMESQEQTYYPEWAFWQAQKGNEVLSELTDAEIESEEERNSVRRMLNTAFLCVLEKPTLRPSMEKVVQMLEGCIPVSHIDLSTLHQGLLFVLRNPSSVFQTHIDEAIANILASSQPATNTTSSSATVSSFYVSTR